MFRAAAPGPYDEAITKATNENLTSEDWGAIIEVCDKVSGDANGPKEAVQGMIKRLAHRNANVQLYTLELGNALSQNCGKNMHRELASRAFTDALLKLANDRNTHQQVKAKILERMKEWSDMFSKDPDLGIMYDAYFRLKQNNPTLQPPSAPQKNRLTDVDRRKEEDELQMALQLSLQEEERKKKASESGSSVPGSSAGAGGSGSGAVAQASRAEPIPSHPTGTTAATVSRVRALYDFVPSEPGELEFKKGDVIAVLESVFKDWWRGSLKGNTGIFPLNYVEKLTDPTPDELHREAQMEAEVFAEIKNVEKLLTLLSTSNTAPREEDNEQISKLYHQTLAIRPKLIKLIEKYSQKKDDFTQLNEKFIKARRDYEALLESSMSHPPGPSYHQYGGRPPMASQGYPGGASGYAPQPQGPPQHIQQDPQRYYTPGPQGPPQEQAPYQASSPAPNFQRLTPGPAPFYLQGAEVSSQAGPPASQPQQSYAQSGPPPGQQQYSQSGPPPTPQQYPPRDQPSRISAVAAGRQPAPLQTSPPPQPYSAYSQPPPQSGPRPQSTYENPQELATSAYDSPVATHNPGGDPYSASVYSTEDPYNTSPTAPSAAPPRAPSGPPQGMPTPQTFTGGPSGLSAPSAPSQPQYTPYNPNPHQRQHQPTYDATSAPTNAPPPVPTASAPPLPSPEVVPHVLSPPPLQPSGPAFNARHGLPSQTGQHGGQPGQPQYKAYVPPGAGAGGSGHNLNEPSAPQDFYRQNTAY
ncbi:VHS domain-containing protein [Xylariales sp. AK1849]|nr:VHS domain-containing protein [Xylariales sp. AK1849]